MILGSIFKWVFMDKDARKAAGKIDATRAKPNRKSPRKAAAGKENDGERDALIKETMALYRQKKVEYDQLDEGMRDKIAKLAEDALSGKKK